jgi:hypothetical protein
VELVVVVLVVLVKNHTLMELLEQLILEEVGVVLLEMRTQVQVEMVAKEL